MVRRLTTMDNGVGSVSEGILILAFQLLMITISFTHVSDFVLGSWEAKSFAEFLNSWTSYEHSFVDCFPYFDVSKGIPKLASFRRKLLLRNVMAPFCTFITVLMLGFEGGYPVTYLYVFHISISLVEDVKVIMSFEVIATGFANLKEAIKLEKSEVKVLKIGEARKLRNLVLFLRNQVSAAGSYQKAHQLSSIMCSMFAITFLTFILLNGTFDSTLGPALRLYLVSVAVVVVDRVHGKIVAGERIAEEVRSCVSLYYLRNLFVFFCISSIQELLFANELEGLDIPEANLAVKLEVTQCSLRIS